VTVRRMFRRTRYRASVGSAPPLGVSEQLGYGHAERVSQLDDCHDARAALGSFDSADVVAVHAGLQAQLLLRDPSRCPNVADRRPKSDQECPSVGQVGDARTRIV